MAAVVAALCVFSLGARLAPSRAPPSTVASAHRIADAMAALGCDAADARATCARLADPAVQRRRHNALCATVYDWLRTELGATALRGDTPLVALRLPVAVDMSAIRARTRRPDLVAVVPARAAGARAELVFVEVTACREHALAARVREKRLKYADVTAALAPALEPHRLAVRETVVVALGELGALPNGLRADLVERARASPSADPERAVDLLLARLVALVRAECAPPLRGSRARQRRVRALLAGEPEAAVGPAASLMEPLPV
jgi:hypothetical protein